METFQMRSSFHAASDQMTTLLWVYEKMSRICSGIRCQLRGLFRCEDVSISPFTDSSSLRPLRDKLMYKMYHILRPHRNTISTISTLCAEERSWTACVALTPAPSVSSAYRTRTSLWPPQNRFSKFYPNPRLCCNFATIRRRRKLSARTLW